MTEAPAACPTCGRPLTGWRQHCAHPGCDWLVWDGCGHLIRTGERIHVMSKPEPDPRTDGVGDSGHTELPPPSEEEIAAGVEHDRQLRQRQIADPATPFREDPAMDEYGP